MASGFDARRGSGGSDDRSLTREEKLRQQEVIQEQRRRNRQMGHGGVMAGGAVGNYSGRRSSGGVTGFVPKPPPSGGVLKERPGITSSVGGGPSQTASVLKSLNDGQIGSSRGSRYRSSEGSSLSGTSARTQTTPITSFSSDTNDTFGISVKMPTETERKLAAGNIRGDVDFSSGRRNIDRDSADDDLSSEVLSDGDRPGTWDSRNPATHRGHASTDDDEHRPGHGDQHAAMAGSSSSRGAEVASPSSLGSSVGSGDAAANAATPSVAPANGAPTTPSSMAPGDAPYIITEEDVGNVAEFIFRPPASEYKVCVNCRFTRHDGTYFMHLELPNKGKKLLLAAKKRKNARSVDYVISLDSTDFGRTGQGYVGKLKSNHLASEFTVYDNGLNPTRSQVLPDFSNAREELAAVVFAGTIDGSIRSMVVMIPNMTVDNERVAVKPKSDSESLIECHKKEKLDQNTCVLENKLPTWNEEHQSYVLNFNGRVTKASVKNFQIVHPDDPEYIVMQFGRISDNQFTLDYSFPMCAMQAFGIALSSCVKFTRG